MAERINYTISARLHDEQWVAYQQRTNLVKSINEDERFFAGKQWNDANFKNMPRVTINYIQFGIKTLASKLAGTPLYLTYASSDEDYDCSKLRQFDEFVRKTIDHDEFSYMAYINGENLGTEIAYVSWNAQDETVGGFYTGGICETHISPLSIAVANPHQSDIQRQEWVMFWTDVPVGQIRDMLEEEGYDKQTLESLNATLTKEAVRTNKRYMDDVNENKDLINQTLVRVYVRFFRVDGEVLYTEETEEVSIHKYPQPMSTEVTSAFAERLQKDWEKAQKDGEPKDSFIRDYKLDYEDTIVNLSRQRNSLEKHRKMKSKFSLYPFAVFTPIPLNNSFFGASKTKQMIPTQKAINYEASMTVKAAENNSYAKVIVKEDALGGQEITNEPGQVLIDYSRNPNQSGYRILEGQPMPNDVVSHVSWLTSSLKETNNFNDSSTGNITNKDTSGYMLQLAIKESNTPVEQEQKMAWKFQKDLARIRVMFYQHYLSKSYYTFEYTDGEVQEQEDERKKILYAANMPQYGQEGFQGNLYMPDGKTLIKADLLKKRYSKPTQKTQVREMGGEPMWGIDFEIMVDAQQGLADSKIAEQQSWDNFILNGGISKLSPDAMELYIKGNPSFTPSFKSEISRYIKQQQHSYIQQQAQQIQQLTQALQQAQAQLQVAGSQMKNMQDQFKQSMNAANRVNALAMQDNDRLRSQQAQTQQYVVGQGNPIDQAGSQLTSATSEGEVKSMSSRGISQS